MNNRTLIHPGCRDGSRCRFARLLVVALGLAGASAMSATDEPAWFFEASGGLSIIPGGDVMHNAVSYEADYDNGTLFMLGLGRSWTEQWSTELEWCHRSNAVDQLVAPGATWTDGDLASDSVFLTVTYNLPEAWRWQGVGAYGALGLGWMLDTEFDLPGVGNFSTDGEVAFHWAVGLDRPVGSAGRLFVEGRAIGGGEQELARKAGGQSLTVDYDAWSLIVGLSWSF